MTQQELVEALGHTGTGALHHKTQGLVNDAVGLQMDDASVARTTAEHTPFSLLQKHHVGLHSVRHGFLIVQNYLIIHALNEHSKGTQILLTGRSARARLHIVSVVMWAGSPQAIWLGSDCSATAGSQAQLLLTKSTAFAQHLAPQAAAS